MQAIERAALEYLKQHWSVIPMRARDKCPAIRWQEFQQRRASKKEINEWFEHWPDDNVGIVTGAISGLVVLDVDPQHGGDESLNQFIREHGPLPHTVESRTGGGGRHVYFSYPSGVVRNKVGLAPGIDVRAEGGCVVAPPSVHSSGKAYTWRVGHAPNEAPLATLPSWLLSVMTGTRAHPGHTLDYWRALIKEGVPEGERNNAVASLAGHLLWHGVDPDVAQELLLCWNRVRCQSPLSDAEVVRTVQSISRLHQATNNE